MGPPSNWYEILNIEVGPTPTSTFTFASTPSFSCSGDIAPGIAIASVCSGLPSTDDNNNAIEWAFSVTGYRSSTETQGICAVSGSEVSATSTARSGDVCRVSVVGSHSGYIAYTSVATVDVTVKAAQSPPNRDLQRVYGSYTQSLAAGGGPYQRQYTPYGGGAHGALEYDARGGGCTVDPSSGALTMSNAASGTECNVFTRWAGDATYAPSVWVQVLDGEVR